MTDKLKSQDQNVKTITKSTTVWCISSREFYDAIHDKLVRVTTTDGKIYTATLVGVDQYDLVLKQGDGALILMPKHAIKLIVPGNGNTE